VHPIHHLALCPEDHGIREINFVHKLHVTHKDPHRVWRTVSPKPMGGSSSRIDERGTSLIGRPVERSISRSTSQASKPSSLGLK
jgi:hypothetical protein